MTARYKIVRLAHPLDNAEHTMDKMERLGWRFNQITHISGRTCALFIWSDPHKEPEPIDREWVEHGITD